MPQSINIANQKFGRLTAIRMTVMGGKKPKRDQRWLFLCDCGNETEADKNDVVRGHTRSCGCLQKEELVERNTIHGHAAGGRVSSEYASWHAMCARCSNPNDKRYADYGARGITVCERWANSFEAFLADMEPKPSPEHQIDRIDNDGHYEPGNCRWAPPLVQQNNRRNNRLLTIGGVNATTAEHAREAGIPYQVLFRRVEAGWSPEILAALLRIYQERRQTV
jgi:hypothetical protein